MVTLKTPDAAATSRQLWLLHILTKTDTRNLKITMQQAHDKISELTNKGNGSSNHTKVAPPKHNLHYCVMYSCEPSKHRMSNGKRKWKAFYTTKDKRKAIKQYNAELARMEHNPSLYPTCQMVIAECRKAILARIMLEKDLLELISSRTGTVFARVVKDSRQG